MSMARGEPASRASTFRDKRPDESFEQYFKAAVEHGAGVRDHATDRDVKTDRGLAVISLKHRLKLKALLKDSASSAGGANRPAFGGEATLGLSETHPESDHTPGRGGRAKLRSPLDVSQQVASGSASSASGAQQPAFGGGGGSKAKAPPPVLEPWRENPRGGMYRRPEDRGASPPQGPLSDVESWIDRNVLENPNPSGGIYRRPAPQSMFWTPRGAGFSEPPQELEPVVEPAFDSLLTPCTYEPPPGFQNADTRLRPFRSGASASPSPAPRTHEEDDDEADELQQLQAGGAWESLVAPATKNVFDESVVVSYAEFMNDTKWRLKELGPFL